MNQTNLSHDDLDRIRQLRDNVLDLAIGIDDLDAELAPQLAERARLACQLANAQAELAYLLQRVAA